MYQLTADAGYSSAIQPVEISREKIAKNIIAIRDIQEDDLFYLEKDLAFHEKVISNIFFFSISKCSFLVCQQQTNECCQCIDAHIVIFINRCIFISTGVIDVLAVC